MAQAYQNRFKNSESHLFGDEPPPKHYEISEETIQGLQSANNNRRKAMDSHLFSDEDKPVIQNSKRPTINETENRNQNLENRNQYQSEQNQYNKYAQNMYNQPKGYHPPITPTQIALKTKLQPLQPPPQYQESPNYQPNQAQPLIRKYQSTQQPNQIQNTQYASPPLNQQINPSLSQFSSSQYQPQRYQPIPALGDFNNISNLNENLAKIDNRLPARSPRNFSEIPSNPNPETRQKPILTPRRSAFLEAPVKESQLPQFTVNELIQNGQIPQLAPFPNLDLNILPIDTNFTFSVKPLTSSGQRYPKKLNLNNQTTNEMKKMRDELERDSQQFESRIKQIEKVEINEPVRPVTAVEDDPLTLDFSFATPRSQWSSILHPEKQRDNNQVNQNAINIPRINIQSDDNDDNQQPSLMNTQSAFIYINDQNEE